MRLGLRFFYLEKAYRNISKLTRKVIINKNGHKQTVYVKLGLPIKGKKMKRNENSEIVKIRNTPKYDLHNVDWEEKYPTIQIIFEGNEESRIETENGKFVLKAREGLSMSLDSVKRTAFRQVDDLLCPLPENMFIRTCHSVDDYNYLRNGKHRGSMNHATGEMEGGLSVAKKCEVPMKYAYFVSGDIIDKGSDGEPLLDEKTARPIGKIMEWDNLYDYYNQLSDEYARTTFGVDRKTINKYFARASFSSQMGSKRMNTKRIAEIEEKLNQKVEKEIARTDRGYVTRDDRGNISYTQNIEEAVPLSNSLKKKLPQNIKIEKKQFPAEIEPWEKDKLEKELKALKAGYNTVQEMKDAKYAEIKAEYEKSILNDIIGKDYYYKIGHDFEVNIEKLMSAIADEAVKQGAELYHVSKESGKPASYYLKKDGKKVRISNHELPQIMHRNTDDYQESWDKNLTLKNDRFILNYVRLNTRIEFSNLVKNLFSEE